MFGEMVLRPRKQKSEASGRCMWCNRTNCRSLATCPLTVFLNIPEVSEAVNRTAEASQGSHFYRAYYGEAEWNGDRPGWLDGIVEHVRRQARCGDKLRCAYCLKLFDPSDTQVDHITPWRDYAIQCVGEINIPLPQYILEGLYNDPQNLAIACEACNWSKGDRPVTGKWLRERRGQDDSDNDKGDDQTARYQRHERRSSGWQPYF